MSGLQKEQIKYNDIEAVLFDFDGVIVPSEQVFLRAWQEVFLQKYNCSFSEDEYIEYELNNNEKLVKYLVDRSRLILNESYQDLMLEVYYAYSQNYSRMLDEYDATSILEFISNWHRHNIKLAIVSTSKRKYIEAFFNRYKNYKQFFSYILCREDVEKLKPDPEIYLTAAKLIGVKRSKCLVVEDSQKGILGALDACMNVVRVTENTLSKNTFITSNVATVSSVKNIILN